MKTEVRVTTTRLHTVTLTEEEVLSLIADAVERAIGLPVDRSDIDLNISMDLLHGATVQIEETVHAQQ